jgi:hypothetical protein
MLHKSQQFLKMQKSSGKFIPFAIAIQKSLLNRFVFAATFFSLSSHSSNMASAQSLKSPLNTTTGNSFLKTQSGRPIQIIYGTAWKKERTTELVRTAVLAGFRAIDTACQPKHYSEVNF